MNENLESFITLDAKQQQDAIDGMEYVLLFLKGTITGLEMELNSMQKLKKEKQ